MYEFLFTLKNWVFYCYKLFAPSPFVIALKHTCWYDLLPHIFRNCLIFEANIRDIVRYFYGAFHFNNRITRKTPKKGKSR